MTKSCHQRASDRTAEALQKVEAALDHRIDIVVMIQGDEPMLRPEMIDEVVAPLLEDQRILVSNLMAPITDNGDFQDCNEVKVVVDKNDNALYFSREPVPSQRKGGKEIPSYKQVCIIPFRREFLLRFNALPPTPLETIESVDMLRVMDHGHKVKMIPPSLMSTALTVKRTGGGWRP